MERSRKEACIRVGVTRLTREEIGIVNGKDKERTKRETKQKYL
jgi:hypothetical protein